MCYLLGVLKQIVGPLIQIFGALVENDSRAKKGDRRPNVLNEGPLTQLVPQP